MTKFLNNADVKGYVAQTAVTSSLLKTDSSGKLVAAVAGTDYNAPGVTASAGTLVREIRNTTGATLTKGTIVYISGATGNKPTVSKALATGDSTSAQTFGLCQTDIANNSNGNVVVIGDITGLDTSAFTEGAQLYLSSTTAGTYTTTKQLAPAHLVYIGVVTRSHPNQGQIEVKIQNGYELDEIHDVSISSLANNQTLVWESATSLWKNKTIASALGYTPADDSAVVKLTGNQTVAGVKTFTSVVNAPTLSLNGGVLAGNNIVSMRSNPTGGQFRIEKSDGSLSAYPFYIGADGTALAYYYNAAGALKVLLHTDGTSYFGNSLSVGYSTYASTSYMLDVNGTGRFISSVNVQNFLTVSSASTLVAPSSGKSIEMVYRTDGANDYAFIQTYDRTNSVFKQLRITGSTLILNEGGTNVGIGTISPSKTLHVYTTGNEGIFLQGSTGGVWMNIQSAAGNLWSIGAQNDGMGVYNRTSSLYAFFIKDNRQLQISGYTSATSYTGTAAGYLAFDSSGNVITVAGVAATDNTKLPLTGGALTGPLSIAGTGTYLGDWGYSTLTLTDTGGYPGIFFKNGSNIWIMRRNGADNGFDWAYSTNASAQGTGTFTQKMRLATDEWWVSTYTGYKLQVTGGDQINTTNAGVVTTLYLQYQGNVGGAVNISAGKFTFSSAGLAVFNGTGIANSPNLRINTSSSASFVHTQENFAANITAGQRAMIFFGKVGSTKNAGGIGYYWSSDASNNNFITLGHWGNDDLLRVYGDGAVQATGYLRTAGATSNTILWAGGASSADFGNVLGQGTSTRSTFFRGASSVSAWWGGTDGLGNIIPFTALDATSGEFTFWRNSGGVGGGSWTQIMTMNASGLTINSGRIIMGSFPNSTTNAGEAWLGRAADRSSGSITVQLGGSTNASFFEVVDYAWTMVTLKVGMNDFSYKGNTVIHAGNIGSQTVSSATSATTATNVASPDGDRNPSTKLPTTNARNVRFDFATSASIGGTGNYGGVMTYAPWDGTSASTGDSSYQLAFLNETGVNASGVPGLSLRSGINSTWNAWYRIITSGNIGSQSVATATFATNSSKLYSTDAAYNYTSAAPYYGYLTYVSPYWLFQVSPATPANVRVARSDSSSVADNVSSISGATGGNYNWTGLNYFKSNRNTSTDSAPLQAFSDNGSGAIMSFHRGGYYAINMGLDSDNVFRIGGWSASPNRLQLDMSGNLTVAATVNAPSGYVSSPNPWGTSDSAFFPNGITTAGTTNWIYGSMTYIGNAPSNGNGHHFTSGGDSRHTGTITPNYIGRPSHSTGFLVGSYNNIGGNSSYTNPIYTIGSSYNPSDSSLGGMYGIGYAHPNLWGSGKTSSWGLYACEGGTINATIGGGAVTIWAQNDIVAYSDIRVKDNIEVIPNAISKIQALRGVTFTRIDAKEEDRSKRHAGVIAQEVLAVHPEVVSGTEKDMYSVAYGNMAGLFIEAFKEQQLQIKELKSIINDLAK